jgi:hypothetical protein
MKPAAELALALSETVAGAVSDPALGAVIFTTGGGLA